MRSKRRIARPAVVAGICLLCIAPPAHAQNPPTPEPASDTLSAAARLVMRQPVGVMLRLNADNAQVTGVLEHVAAGTVHLTGPPRVVTLSSITDAWLQRRSTGRGGKVGAIVGGSAGAATFGLGAALLSALCESDCDDWGAGDIAVATLIGAAAGAASGYVVGALIGASVPRWERLTESSEPATIMAQDPRRYAGLSAISVTPVIARAAEGDDRVGAGIGISYLSQLSHWIAVGGELARYDVARQLPRFVPCEDPDFLCTEYREGDATWSVGGLARLGAGAERRVEPYVLLGVGVTGFGEATLGGYSVGPGVRYRPGNGRLAFSGEARWHSNLTNSGDDTQLGFYTVGIAASLLR